MEWLKKMSLRKSLFLVIIATFAFGNVLNQLVLYIVGSITGGCMCGGSTPAILMNVILSFAIPITIASVFYNIKLKTPLAQLGKGAERIKANDLDFSLKVSSKDELGQLCESFEAMRVELLDSNRKLWQQMDERKRLNAAFAHDLRNPVTVLKGSAAILQEGLKKGNLIAESASESIGLITQYTARIACYIQAMISVQKLEELSFSPAATNWLKLTRELKRSLHILGTYAGKTVDFIVGGANKEINVDSHILHNVAENLVSNALRHAQDTVIIKLHCSKEEITISVTDDGSGFSSSILKAGAVPFLRDTNTPQPQGQNFGMGLYICDMLCKKHGGGLILANHHGGAVATAKFISSNRGE